MLAESALRFGQDWERSSSGLLVPPRRRRYVRPTCIDLYAGAGGFSLGVHRAGFHVLAAVELDPAAAVTYTVNLGMPGMRLHFQTPELEAKFAKLIDPESEVERALKGEPASSPGLLTGFPTAGSGYLSGHPAEAGFGCHDMWVWDASSLTGEQLLAPLGLEPGEVDVVVGGPPCQGFSKAGRRDIADPRNNCVFEFARLVCEICPRSFVIENVPGIMTMRLPDGRSVVDELCAILERGEFGEFDALKKALLARTDAAHARRESRKSDAAGLAAAAAQVEDEEELQLSMEVG